MKISQNWFWHNFVFILLSRPTPRQFPLNQASLPPHLPRITTLVRIFFSLVRLFVCLFTSFHIHITLCGGMGPPTLIHQIMIIIIIIAGSIIIWYWNKTVFQCQQIVLKIMCFCRYSWWTLVVDNSVTNKKRDIRARDI